LQDPVKRNQYEREANQMGSQAVNADRNMFPEHSFKQKGTADNQFGTVQLSGNTINHSDGNKAGKESQTISMNGKNDGNITNVLIFQSVRKKGLDANGGKANDMKTNDFIKDQLLAINKLFGLQIAEADFPGLLFSELKLMSQILFAQGNMENVILDMIDHFEKGGGNDYRNATLSNRARQHVTTKNYINYVKKTLITFLQKHYNPIKLLDESNRKNNLFYRAITSNVRFPVFHSWRDILGGLTITVNDTWGNLIEVRNYSVANNRFQGTLRFTFYDHFGLDRPDVEKMYVNLAGFRAWFVLQHFQKFNGIYKPFVAIMEVEVPFHGYCYPSAEQK